MAPPETLEVDYNETVRDVLSKALEIFRISVSMASTSLNFHYKSLILSMYVHMSPPHVCLIFGCVMCCSSNVQICLHSRLFIE